MGKKIKICGLRRDEDIDYVNEFLPDYMGFVFANTRRYISPEEAGRLKKKLDDRIKSVGVFVNSSAEEVAEIAKAGTIDLVQLHGDEDEAYIEKLRELLPQDKKIIKAVRVRETDDIIKADKLDVDYLLLDTYRKGQYGGTGETFSWSLIPTDLNHPYFLAGGLDETNILSAARTTAFALDISGGVETDGYKDAEKIRRVISRVREL